MGTRLQICNLSHFQRERERDNRTIAKNYINISKKESFFEYCEVIVSVGRSGRDQIYHQAPLYAADYSQ